MNPYSYHSYLVRCWPESQNDDDLPSWRYVFQSITTKQQVGFTDIDEMVEALKKELIHLQHQTDDLIDE